MAPRQGTRAYLESVRLLGVGDPKKHLHNFVLGCVHHFYEVGPINGFLQSLKEMDDFPKSKEPRHKG